MSLSKNNTRVLYFGMINTSHYSKVVGHKLYVAAGSLKMLSVVRSLKSVGVCASIITLPVLGSKYPEHHMRVFASGKDGVPILFLQVYRNKIIRKLFGALSFASVSLFLVRRHDKIIIYNHAIEYIPAILILYLRRIPLFHDIEDLPFENDFSLNGLINSVGFWFANTFSFKKILVSKRLADMLSLNDYLVVNGVCNLVHQVSSKDGLLYFPAMTLHYVFTLVVL